MHRVVIASGDANIRAKARMSMAYFTIPDNDFPVKSLLGHSDLPPVTSAEYIHEKITSTSHYWLDKAIPSHVSLTSFPLESE